MAGFNLRPRLQACFATLLLVAFAIPLASAQQPVRPATAARPATPIIAPIAPAKSWRQLSAAEKVALQPLAAQWDRMESTRRERWMGIASRFSTMKPDEQRRMHERMRDWSRMSPEERRVARENYRRSKRIAPNSKSAQWEQYKQLPEAQKKKLAADAAKPKPASGKPAIKVPPKAIQVVPAAPARAPELACPVGTVKNTSAPSPVCIPSPVVTAPPIIPPATPAAPVPHAK